MEQDRDERFQTAMDVRRALDEIATTSMADVLGQEGQDSQESQRGNTGRARLARTSESFARTRGAEGSAATSVRRVSGAEVAGKEADDTVQTAILSHATDKNVHGAVPNLHTQRRIKIAFTIAGLAAIGLAAFFFTFAGKNQPAAGPASLASSTSTTVPAEAPIDWINARPEIVRPWAPDWGLKDGMLTPTKENVRNQLGIMRDGLVRMRR